MLISSESSSYLETLFYLECLGKLSLGGCDNRGVTTLRFLEVAHDAWFIDTESDCFAEPSTKPETIFLLYLSLYPKHLLATQADHSFSHTHTRIEGSLHAVHREKTALSRAVRPVLTPAYDMAFQPRTKREKKDHGIFANIVKMDSCR